MQQTIFNNRYELDEKIGEGGMARVYRGRDLRLGRTVAIKVLHRQYATDPGFLNRFRHEAAAAARLDHPGIVRVFDVGQDGDVPYIVMEYIPGSDLKTLILRNGALPTARAVAIAEQVAEAMDAAHHIGLVHRDLKPQNILITPEGHAKITDFGIAKSELSTSVTETGVIFGTADYLSPEQARGQAATTRSDVYAIGVTLFEMLTGRLPFTGDNPIGVAMQHLNAPPPLPRLYNPRIPPRLEAIVLQTLSKDPAARPASAADLAWMLRAWREAGDGDTLVQGPLAPGAPPARMTAPRPAPRPLPQTGTTDRTVLPPRRPAPAPPPPDARGAGCGGFILGLLLIAGVAGLVYMFAIGAFDGLLSFTSAVGRLPATSPAATVSNPTAVPLAIVPDVLNRDPADATRLIQEARLSPVADPPRNSDTVPAGKVMDQFPRAGTSITETSVVTFALSLGPASIEIPAVQGLTPQAARAQLEAAGFKVQLAEESSSSMSAGFVTRTEPAPPARPQRGDTVTVYVSIGNRTRMPDVTGRSEDEARTIIAAAGLFVSYVDYQGRDKLGNLYDEVAPGTVVSSIPRGGELVEQNSGVTLGVRAPDQASGGENDNGKEKGKGKGKDKP
jgi:serine/threonine-protein kinase